MSNIIFLNFISVRHRSNYQDFYDIAGGSSNYSSVNGDLVWGYHSNQLFDPDFSILNEETGLIENFNTISSSAHEKGTFIPTATGTYKINIHTDKETDQVILNDDGLGKYLFNNK